ncbi:MAG: DNA methyltransferase [Promethearchaeota archaeon]
MLGTVLHLSNKKKKNISKRFSDDDNRFPEVLVEHFLKKYTNSGDKVLDVFAGLGTTLFVAEDMEREPWGLEKDKDRFRFIQSQLSPAFRNNMVLGDALLLDSYDLPQMDFFLTSPPYMNQQYWVNPLTEKNEANCYTTYLEDIRKVFTNVTEVMRPGGRVVVEVANLKGKGRPVTTLAWDIAKEVAQVLKFEGEVVVAWEGEESDSGGTYGCGYDHSYCLIFQT